MPGALKYIVDEDGNKTSVLVPVKIWEDLNLDTISSFEEAKTTFRNPIYFLSAFLMFIPAFLCFVSAYSAFRFFTSYADLSSFKQSKTNFF